MRLNQRVNLSRTPVHVDYMIRVVGRDGGQVEKTLTALIGMEWLNLPCSPVIDHQHTNEQFVMYDHSSIEY